MKLGVPKETKNHEYRVSMTPASVSELTRRKHIVVVEHNAGKGVGFSDDDYLHAGATLVESAEQVFSVSDMLIKVKEPQAHERAMLRPDQLLFTYLHLAPDQAQAKDLVESRAIAIAYETITSASGHLPLLAPMSEVAGRMSVQAGAHCLEKAQGGGGVLLAGVPGVAAGKVVIIGGGVVGANAAKMAIGLGANVTVFDNNIDTLRRLESQFGSSLQLLYSTRDALFTALIDADLVIGAVLIPGAAAPKLVTKEMVKMMKPGSVIVDVAIDQGGCFETSKPTSHQQPTYLVDGVVHYCVTNMPGGLARTASLALNNATLPYIIKLADTGWKKALADDPNFLNGLNVCRGSITNLAVADSLGYSYAEPRAFVS